MSAIVRVPPLSPTKVESTAMWGISQLIEAVAVGKSEAAAELLPLVYAELRRLAADRLANEKAGHTLQPTELVHEAYVRLVGGEQAQDWNGRAHFFAAAAEAMRRILIESARRKGRVRHGGGRQRVDLDEALAASVANPSDVLLDLDDALMRLEAADETAARLVKLRYFAGLSMQEAADAVGLPLRTAERNWTYARTWLHRELSRTP